MYIAGKGSSGELFWARWWSFGLHRRRCISWVFRYQILKVSTTLIGLIIQWYFLFGTLCDVSFCVSVLCVVFYYVKLVVCWDLSTVVQPVQENDLVIMYATINPPQSKYLQTCFCSVRHKHHLNVTGLCWEGEAAEPMYCIGGRGSLLVSCKMSLGQWFPKYVLLWAPNWWGGTWYSGNPAARSRRSIKSFLQS
jgi:hypothetical protein